MHYHFILAEPLVSRLKLPLDQHFVANQSMYRGKFGIVSKVKVKRIIELGEQLPDYLFKHITRGSFSRDDLLILPAINKAEANQNF